MGDKPKCVEPSEFIFSPITIAAHCRHLLRPLEPVTTLTVEHTFHVGIYLSGGSRTIGEVVVESG